MSTLAIEIYTFWKCKICGHKQDTQKDEEWPSCPKCKQLLNIGSGYKLNAEA